MGGGKGDSGAADESNAMMRSQVEEQRRVSDRKTKAAYSDALVSLKSTGDMQYEAPQADGMDAAAKAEIAKRAGIRADAEKWRTKPKNTLEDKLAGITSPYARAMARQNPGLIDYYAQLTGGE